MTPDPLGGDVTNPQSLNRYAYVLNNPTTLTDPLGLCAGCKLLEVGYADLGDEFNDIFNYDSEGDLWFGTPVSWTGSPAAYPGPGGGGGGGPMPAPPATPGPKPQSQTSACTVSNGRTTAPSPGQAPGRGAFGFIPPRGSVAIDPWALGLLPGPRTNALLGPDASQITFSFTPTVNLPSGFPTTFTLGDIVGPAGVRAGGSNFNGLYDFDIYGLPSLAAARAATSPEGVPVSVTVTFPSSLPINCGGPLLDSPLSFPLSTSPAAVAARALR